MPKCIELLPCDWLISNLCYQAIEQMYLIIYIYLYIHEEKSLFVKNDNSNCIYFSESTVKFSESFFYCAFQVISSKLQLGCFD